MRIQGFLLVSLTNPTFLFDEMLAHKDSFATAVEKPVLKVFIEDILSRMMQHEVVFDHLANSSSHVHSDFVPYTKKTFLVLSKLVEDLVADGSTQAGGGALSGQIPRENFLLLNKILASEQVTTKVFDSSEQASSVIGRYLTQQRELLLEEQARTGETRGGYSGLDAQVDRLSTYDTVFRALRAVKPLVSKDSELRETIAASVEVALANLIRDINRFSGRPSKELSFAREQFPLD